MTAPWRAPAAALAMLALAWLLWRGAGWLVGQYGLAAGPLVQQAALFVLFLALVEWLAARLRPADDSGEHHG